MKAIGKVDILEGNVTVTKADGTQILLSEGDNIFQGDEINTGSSGNISMIFEDGSAFAMGSDGAMVIDEMIYDPATQEGSMGLSVLTGIATC